MLQTRHDQLIVRTDVDVLSTVKIEAAVRPTSTGRDIS
jgi:hypothetical protein